MRPTGRFAVAAVNEASDVEQQLILLREPALRKKEGDRAATLRQISVGRQRVASGAETELAQPTNAKFFTRLDVFDVERL